MNEETKAVAEAPAREGSNEVSGIGRRDFVKVVGAGAVAATMLKGRTALADPAAPIYRIHPAIGVARVGNAPNDTFFLGPEVPGAGPTEIADGSAVAQFKSNDQVRPQAARFRVFEYAWVAGVLTPKGEVTVGQNGVSDIAWTVHVANKKAAFFCEDGAQGEVLAPGPLRNASVVNRTSLITDFGAQTIHSGSAPVSIAYNSSKPLGDPSTGGQYWVQDPNGNPVIPYHGELRVDAAGRLVYIGGKGLSASNLATPPVLGHWSNNDNWFDDIADGPVSATVTVTGSDGITRRVPMDPGVGNAWVLCAPARPAPGIRSAITLYDTLYDMAARSQTIPSSSLYQGNGPLARLAKVNSLWPWQPGAFQPDYDSEILPILQAAVNYVYVTGLVNAKHGSMQDPTLGSTDPSAAKTRFGVFTYLRPPSASATNMPGQTGTMPHLYGDDWYQGNNNFHFNFETQGNGAGGNANTPNHFPAYQRYMTLKQVQYALMQEWSNGNFVPSSSPLPPVDSTPFDLDRAALENCIGGPFYPGIEVSWQIRNPKLFAEPFRLMWDPNPNMPNAVSQYLVDANLDIEGTPIGPGHFSRQMALPWQADFNDCVRLLNLSWWPSARPDDVFINPTDTLNQRVPWSRPSGQYSNNYSAISSHEDMVAAWWKYGRVALDPASGVYIESERFAGTVP